MHSSQRPISKGQQLSSPDFSLASSSAISSETALKSILAEACIKDGLNYFNFMATRGLMAYYSSRTWHEEYEQHKKAYLPLVQHAAALGRKMLAAHTHLSPSASSASAAERHSAYDSVLQPLMVELIGVLRSCRRIVPELLEAETRKRVMAEIPGIEQAPATFEAKVDDIVADWRHDLIDVERRVRALALLESEGASDLDLVTTIRVLASATPGSSIRRTEAAELSIMVCCPAARGEATLRVVAVELYGIAVNLRELLQRRVSHLSVAEIGGLGQSLDADGTLNHLLNAELLVLEATPAGELRLVIPVPIDDYQTLEWLKTRLDEVLRVHTDSLRELGTKVYSAVSQHPTDSNLLEFGIGISFKLDDAIAFDTTPPIVSSSAEVIADAICAQSRTSSLKRVLQGGRTYFTAISPTAQDKCLTLSEHNLLKTIDAFVMLAGDVECVRISYVEAENHDVAEDDSADQPYGRSSTNPWQEEVERNQSTNADESINIAVSNGLIFTFCDHTGAAQRARQEALQSFSGTQQQLEAIAFAGVRQAGVVPDPPIQGRPCTYLVLTEGLLKDKEAVDLLSELLLKYHVGTIELLVEPAQAKEFICAAMDAAALYEAADVQPASPVMDVAAENSAPRQLTIQIWSPYVEAAEDGSNEIYASTLRISDIDGRIVVEGRFCGRERSYLLTSVPQVVIAPLTEAIANALREQIETHKVLLPGPFIREIERQGFLLSNKMFFPLYEFCKPFQSRKINADTSQQIEAAVRYIFINNEFLAPHFDGSVWHILTQDDLPAGGNLLTE